MANSYQQRVLRRQLSAADYLGSRGADGIDALRRLVAETEAGDGDGEALVALPPGWARAIPLKGACMNGHVRTLAYLVDVCRADVDLVDEETGTRRRTSRCPAGPARLAWRRLLARGARHDVRDRAGLTLAGAARRRLELLDRGDTTPSDYAQRHGHRRAARGGRAAREAARRRGEGGRLVGIRGQFPQRPRVGGRRRGSAPRRTARAPRGVRERGARQRGWLKVSRSRRRRRSSASGRTR